MINCFSDRETHPAPFPTFCEEEQEYDDNDDDGDDGDGDDGNMIRYDH